MNYNMDNNLLNDVFYIYPKSTNKKIIFTKKNDTKLCDLNLNCVELNFSINENKFITNRLQNNNVYNNNQISKTNNNNSIWYEYFNLRWFMKLLISNCDIVIFVFVILILIFILKK